MTYDSFSKYSGTFKIEMKIPTNFLINFQMSKKRRANGAILRTTVEKYSRSESNRVE